MEDQEQGERDTSGAWIADEIPDMEKAWFVRVSDTPLELMPLTPMLRPPEESTSSSSGLQRPHPPSTTSKITAHC